MRFLLALFAMLVVAPPAHADDITAAGRGVVRVVTIAVAEDEVVGFGHGSGFAISPTRIVTNAHVVELAARYPGNVVIGVVPSDGDQSVQGKLVAVDPARDLALIEVTGVRLAPLALYAGPAGEGEAMIALGYPGNVDLATARSAADFITPTSPVRSQGVFSGRRSLAGTDMLLHTASIARGNSGGPLLDRCGRVLGVNSALTRGDDGDASFALAIADTELIAFLREAKQPVASVGTPCMTMEERLAADRAADDDAKSASDVASREAMARQAAARDAALVEGRAAAQVRRENYMAAAALVLVAGALALGAAGLLLSRGDRRWRYVAVAGGVLVIGAIATFFLRPSFDPRSVAAAHAARATTADATGPMLCSFDAARSRVTVSQPEDTKLSWGGNGCINGRTQYAEDGRGGYARVLVPDGESTVSILAYQPATRTYTNTRYFLDAARMAEARRLRKGVSVKACTDDGAARANLSSQQSAIRAALPQLPNEKLVYTCKPAG
ncbi:trypsin-like peptidase domain-containing protein [Sphingomonas donggukensis]|uniref:Trypsin-like peptidase domain-containing protein n=1 Tax=Sphingomonas donggukensis TaxID=2949093 RepID=A0ABY4TU73_9SPHN|nr:trypsin-like peptidase domain-containing protein [Sphingomonas donggukensis]URW75953.1 trypsin-like peptidase domain-containing protein [Sphingomonas donggukensis]